MKRYSTFILLLLFVQQVSAGTFYEQLCDFNFNWKKYALRAPEGKARDFKSEKDYVQAHLGSVLAILRSNPVDQLNAEQFRSRTHLIELLDGYRAAGNFPINYHRLERIPVFIDKHKTHCAVAYLMQQTGHEDMATRIAATDNYAWLKDIHDAELPAWQKASGLTVEELKLIQGAYDFYIPNALMLPNKYEVPQKPACMILYFENKQTGKKMPAKPANIWCMGEGKNGVLNGRWIQNYAVGLPWIVGYYENGKRTGQWEEYYQGTNQLCRTEVWRNDKLNGIRKRFDREGNLIEEIYFKDGNAITKTNYDLNDSLVWVRKPLDSNRVYTEVLTLGGSLIASGHEKVHNPGNLLWFQNIELTALNSASITSREISVSPGSFIGNGPFSIRSFGGNGLYNTPPLVEYKKEGTWVYYKEHNKYNAITKPVDMMKSMLVSDYKHFGDELSLSIMIFDDFKINAAYDSIRVVYDNNDLQSLYGYSANDYTHLHIRYYEKNELSKQLVVRSSRYPLHVSGHEYTAPAIIKECGHYNKANQKISVWKHFDTHSRLYKTESFILPWKEEEAVILQVSKK